MRNIVLLGICLSLLAGCERESVPREDTNEQYQMGYDMGHAAGVLEERGQLCSQIKNFRPAMAAVLKDADICPKTP